MSGAIAVTTAAIAVGVAVEVGGPFAIIAAVGAVTGAVGAITKVKELQYVGMALGAVGAIGGLASAAGIFAEGGLFGSEAASLGSAVQNASGFAEGAGPLGASGGATTGGIEAEIANWSSYGADAASAAAQAPADAVQAAAQAPVSAAVNPTTGAAAAPATADTPVVQGATGAPAEIVASNTNSPLNAALKPTAGTPSGNIDAEIADWSKYGTGILDAGSPVPVSGAPDLNASNPATGANPEVGTGDGIDLSTNPQGAANPQGGTLVPADGGVHDPLKTSGGLINSGTSPSGYNNLPTDAIPKATSAIDYIVGGGPGGSLSGTGPNAINDSSSIWKDVFEFAKDQKLLGPALTAGASFLSGALDGTKPAQIQAYEAQAAAYRAQANAYNANAATQQQQLANMQSGVPRGMINRPAAVTGRPA